MKRLALVAMLAAVMMCSYAAPEQGKEAGEKATLSADSSTTGAKMRKHARKAGEETSGPKEKKHKKAEKAEKPEEKK